MNDCDTKEMNYLKCVSCECSERIHLTYGPGKPLGVILRCPWSGKSIDVSKEEGAR